MEYFTIFPDSRVAITIIIYSRAPVISGNVVKIKIIAPSRRNLGLSKGDVEVFRRADGDVKSLTAFSTLSIDRVLSFSVVAF